MKSALKTLFVPMGVIALTALGVVATTLTETTPSSVADIGVTPESPLTFIPHDSKELDG